MTQGTRTLLAGRTVGILWLAGAALGGISCGEDGLAEPTGTANPWTAEATLSVASNTWAAKHSLPLARNDHKAATLNGIIYAVAGRSGGVTNTVVAYNLATNTWSSRQSLPSGRESTNGVSPIGGRLFMTGGARGSLGLTKTLFVYNPGSNTWVQRADMPETGGCGVQGVIAGLLYVYSGCVADRLFRYDPATNRWVTLTPPPTSHAHGGGGAISGKFYLAGGSHVEDGFYVAHAQLDIYDPVTDTWTTGAPMPQRAQLTASAVLNQKLFVAGGLNYPAESNALMIYRPLSNTWAIRAPMPATRTWTAGAAAGGQFFVIGGKENGVPTRKVLAYTP